MPSTSWQWDPETKQAICCYCGFTTGFVGDAPGRIAHDCDQAKHPVRTSRQGLSIGRSPRPEVVSRVPLDQVLACIHRGPEIRQDPCKTCGNGVRIKVFACQLHNDCQLDGKIAGIRNCAICSDRRFTS
jgi:hypothetical protein